MKVSILQSKLQKAVSSVSRIVNTNNSLPILGTILLTTNDGFLELQATNLELAIIYKLGVKLDKKGSLCVPARLFQEIIQSINEEKVTIQSKKDNLHIQTTKLQSVLNGISAADFPQIPEIKTSQEITLSAQDFTSACESIIHIVSLDESRPILTGLNLQIKNNELILATTDSYRLAEVKYTLKSSENCNITLPSQTINELLRIVKNENSENIIVKINKTEVVFQLGDITLISQQIEGKYPDYTKIIPKQHTTRVVINKTELINSVKIAALFSRETAQTITLHITNSGLEITSQTSQVGTNNSKITADIQGKPIEINLNARYILDALNAFSGDEIVIELQDKLDPCVILPLEKNTKQIHIIMPLRS